MGCIRIATALQANSGLRLLDLSDNMFKDRGLQAIIRSLSNYPRKSSFDLVIRGVEITDATAVMLLNLLQEVSPQAPLRIGMANSSTCLSPFYRVKLKPYIFESTLLSFSNSNQPSAAADDSPSQTKS
jgi:hypothetical protein